MREETVLQISQKTLDLLVELVQISMPCLIRSRYASKTIFGTLVSLSGVNLIFVVLVLTINGNMVPLKQKLDGPSKINFLIF